MLKRLWNYQLLLGGSLKSTNIKKSPKQASFIIFIYMLIVFTLSLILGQGGFIFYPTIFTLYAVYSIVNSSNKLFEIVPVLKLYSLINIYIYVFISITLANTLLLIIGKLLAHLSASMGMNVLINSWKNIFVIESISTIVASILLPIFFIKLNSLRKKLIISVNVIVPIALLLFNKMPVVTEFDKVHFWKSITIMPNYNQFLLILACVCVIILPVSMLISYKLYKGKRCTTC